MPVLSLNEFIKRIEKRKEKIFIRKSKRIASIYLEFTSGALCIIT